MTTDTNVLDQQTFASIGAAKQEPAWLAQSRAEALALASTLPLPKLEKTRIDRWTLGGTGAYRPAKPVLNAAELPGELANLIGDNPSPNLLVQHDSGVVFVRVSPELESQGVILKSLEQAAVDHPELVQQYFMQAVKKDEHRLTALHAALWNGGLFLYVPKNVEVKEPIQAIFYSENPEATFAPHVLIVADTHSSVTYVDNYLSAASETKMLHNGVLEVFAKPGASVRVATVHDLGGHVTDVNYRRAVLENDAKIEWIIGELSHGNGVADTYSILKGNGSNSDMKVIAVGVGDQKLNYTTRAVHFGKSSASDMITRAVMRDEATGIINGITKIEHGATKADGQQTERVLMLSPKARGDANPILLIDEDDVTAGHAASVGQVNPEQVYYLMSRGIPKPEAERLIIYGFLYPVIEEIPLEALREQLSALVERKLGQ
ncbi:Fe-S cluster assembly protein SufD [Paenibacillus antri]|uniref:Fe-S cluster assembly protein SufD n=1 Tax=Paenibacillus antri TaxID=2582848 RepID=A0A5R9G5M3_9BACL|nr:Fe-S cluster assembly protein SufD [Paenibacillus antri]TLS51081.1 Fe-S cluster assembly protein SufD [Paenibacillus antri]